MMVPLLDWGGLVSRLTPGVTMRHWTLNMVRMTNAMDALLNTD